MSKPKDLDNLLQKFLDEKHLPGAALSVCLGEDLIYENFVGDQDMAHTKPLTPDTIFRIHSITKAVSAICGMKEYERGAFLMDEPVYAYMPEFKDLKVSVRQPDGSWTVEDSKEPMLIRHLFNMNVGYYSFEDNPTARAMQEVHDRLGGSKFQSDYTLHQEVSALAEVPMLFEPGTHWQYGYGIDMMAVLVEVTSGMTLGEYMKKNLFEPLGMKDTDFRFRPGWRDRTAECVKQLPDGTAVHCDDILGDPIDSMYRETAVYEAADAGLLSTLHDLQAFSGMMANGGKWNGEQVIGRKTLDMMRQNLLTPEMLKEFRMSVPDVNGYGYGYGVRTLIDREGGNCSGSLGEFGWVGAAGAWMMADPEEKLSVAFMIQDMLPDSHYYHDRLRAVINGLL